MQKVYDFIKKLGNGERYQTLAGIIAVLMFVWFVGCTSKVSSITNPGQAVSRDELHIEIDTFLAQAENKLQSLDQQDAVKRLLAEQTMLIAKGGAVNPAGIMVLLGGIFGIGATVDNVRKRKVIKRLENGTAKS